MPYDKDGEFWTEKRGNVFMKGNLCYKPPPDYEDKPPLPMPHGEEESQNELYLGKAKRPVHLPG